MSICWRADLQPEPAGLAEEVTGRGAGWALAGWTTQKIMPLEYEQARMVQPPAAGHLGIVEVFCVNQEHDADGSCCRAWV